MNLQIGKQYNFETHAPALLGTGYKNAVVRSIMDYGSAIRERDITALHSAVFSSLPQGTSENPADSIYVSIRLPSGETTILANTWIREDSIEEVVSSDLRFTVINAGATELSRIRDLLAMAGYTIGNSSIIPHSQS